MDTLSANAGKGLLCANNRLHRQHPDQHGSPHETPICQFLPQTQRGIKGDTGKFAFDAVRLGNEKYVIGKMDHYFSASTTLTGSYSYDNTSVTFPDFYNEKLSVAPAGKQNAVLTLQHIFSPSLINNTRAGVSVPLPNGNNIDCCVKLPGLSDRSLGFVPGQPVGTFNVTGIANISGTALWGGIGSSGLNNFYYSHNFMICPGPKAATACAWVRC